MKVSDINQAAECVPEFLAVSDQIYCDQFRAYGEPEILPLDEGDPNAAEFLKLLVGKKDPAEFLVVVSTDWDTEKGGAARFYYLLPSGICVKVAFENQADYADYRQRLGLAIDNWNIKRGAHRDFIVRMEAPAASA